MMLVAVLGEQPELEVVAARQGKKRPVPPPARAGQARRLPDRFAPQTRPCCDCAGNGQPLPQADTARAQRGSFGKPSTISPMMLRWICDEPA
jgi:hypothetical protein